MPLLKNASVIVFCIFFLFIEKGKTQTDTLRQLEEVVVKAYFSERPLMRLPASITVISPKNLQEQQSFSLVSAVNTAAGVRMEERSPGSYRLSVRGSLLRSPFGIRNIKIYFEDFPLTDAGGNTYLNSFDASAIHSIEIIKGPEASIFGANTGGVVIISPIQSNDSSAIKAGISAGAFGTFHQNLMLQTQLKNYKINVQQAFFRSDGYRENSAMQRHYVHVLQQWNYKPGNFFQAFLLFSDLQYETPGGLTLAQMNENPASARPATQFLPGAKEQKAGIFNQTFYGGIRHEWEITKKFRHHINIYGSRTDFKNPFITNYELRKENTLGTRTYVELKISPKKRLNFNWNTGLEWQKTNSSLNNFGNRFGTKDTLQAADKIRAMQHFYFTQFSAEIGKRWWLEAALSYNFYNNFYNTIQPGEKKQNINFKPQLMPRFAASFALTENFVLRSSVSRGYSPPSMAEIRPSDNNIYNGLQAENGWNYETGVRLRNRNGRFWADAAIFYFALENAIVRRINNSGQEFFTNAGGTNQAGAELQWSYWILPLREKGALRGLEFRNSFTYYHFRFCDYKNGDEDYTGNPLTGVPGHVSVTALKIFFPANFTIFAQQNYTGKIPLNDANSEEAAAYNLVQLKLSYRKHFWRNAYMDFNAGADNLLNETYSLGNDLNAFGGRFYNPAPPRNFYAGVEVMF